VSAPDTSRSMQQVLHGVVGQVPCQLTGRAFSP
jgi:hypothetical protein